LYAYEHSYPTGLHIEWKVEGGTPPYLVDVSVKREPSPTWVKYVNDLPGSEGEVTLAIEPSSFTWISTADRDGDGLEDGAETTGWILVGPTDGFINMSVTTNPEKPDTDGDGLIDSYEVQNALAEMEAGKTITTNPIDPDTDDDGLTDGHEYWKEKRTACQENIPYPGVWEDGQFQRTLKVLAVVTDSAGATDSVWLEVHIPSLPY